MAAEGLVWRIAGLRSPPLRLGSRTTVADARTFIALLRHWKSPLGAGQSDAASQRDEGSGSSGQLVPEADELVTDLTRRFWDRLRFFAARRLRDVGQAEDVAQEVLRRTLEALRGGRVENPDALPAFVFQTARHICMQRARSAGREARAYSRFASGADDSTQEDPLRSLISQERREAVRDAIALMEEPERDLLRMCFGEGLDSEEIARRLEITPGAVRVRKHRALERLTELLGVTKKKDRELS